MVLYLLVPAASEHLYNLEAISSLVVTTAEWQLKGIGRAVPTPELPPELSLIQAPQARGSVVIAATPQRLQIGLANGCGFRETIDITELTLHI
jgi:hypothetical protein